MGTQGAGRYGFIFLAALALAAWAGGGIDSSVSVKKVIVELDGQEILLSAKQIHPGDVLEYTLTFSNSAEFEFSEVEAIFPIPAGTTYIKGTAHPAEVDASLDGAQFARVPLMYKAPPGGTGAPQEAPQKKYRALRWIIATLEPGAKVTMKARVRKN